MDGGLGALDGGIASLLELLTEHREAIEYDLICLGRNIDDLGTRRLSWRDLLVIVRRSPRDSALNRALWPDEWEWDLHGQVGASILDALRVLIWQKTQDAQKGRNYPEPTPRPGIEPSTKTHGGGSLSMDEMHAWLGWDKTA